MSSICYHPSSVQSDTVQRVTSVIARTRKLPPEQVTINGEFAALDIDSIDAGFVPGTGSPEPGGLLPREALKALRMVAREGICGMEVVEIAPPYDVSDMTAQLGCRAIMDVLGTLVEEGHLGTRPKSDREREQPREAPAPPTGD